VSQEYKGLRTRNLFEGASDSGKISKYLGEMGGKN
jgi:hypothetical protein